MITRCRHRNPACIISWSCGRKDFSRANEGQTVSTKRTKSWTSKETLAMLVECYWNMMEYDGIWWNMMDWMWILWLNANSENKSKEYPQQQHLYMKKSTHVCRNDVWELFEINREKTFDWPSVGNNKNFAWTPVPGHLACSAVLAAPKLTLLGKKSWRDVQSMEWWSSMTFHVSSSKCADWDIFRHNSKHRPLPQWSDAKCLLP